MAKIGQNDVLAEFLHELIMRSSLIITDDKGTAHVVRASFDRSILTPA